MPKKKKPPRSKREPARAGAAKPKSSTKSVDLPKLRHSLGLKQAHLGALLNVDIMTVSRWERGMLSPRSWHLAMLACFNRAVQGKFTWGSVSPYQWNRFPFMVAWDADFELPKIPDRLREVLNAAFLVDHKPSEEKKDKK